MLIALCMAGSAFIGCKTLYIKELNRTPEFTLLNDAAKSAIAVGDMEIEVGATIDPMFKERYFSPKAFTYQYLHLFTYNLRLERALATVNVDTSRIWSLQNADGSTKVSTSIDSLFANATTDYIFTFPKFQVYIETELNDTRYLNRRDLSSMSMETTQSIIVVAQVCLYDRKTRKPLIEFQTKGVSRETNYNFAIQDAMNISIRNAISFLRTGTTKF